MGSEEEARSFGRGFDYGGMARSRGDKKIDISTPAETYIPVETLACSVHKKSVVQVH